MAHAYQSAASKWSCRYLFLGLLGITCLINIVNLYYYPWNWPEFTSNLMNERDALIYSIANLQKETIRMTKCTGNFLTNDDVVTICEELEQASYDAANPFCSISEHDLSVKLDNLRILGIPRLKRSFAAVAVVADLDADPGASFQDMKESIDSLTTATPNNDQLKFIVILVIRSSNRTLQSRIMSYVKDNYLLQIGLGFIHVIYFPSDLFDFSWGACGPTCYLNSYILVYAKLHSDYVVLVQAGSLTVNGYSGILSDIVNDKLQTWSLVELSHSHHLADMIPTQMSSRMLHFMGRYHRWKSWPVLLSNFSTLHGQVKRLIIMPDVFFKEASKIVKSKFDIDEDVLIPVELGDNPPATLHSSLPHYDVYEPQWAYTKHGFFWLRPPIIGENYLLIVFASSREYVKRIIIETGSKHHPGHILTNAVLKATNQAVRISPSSAEVTCKDFQTIGLFNKRGNIDARNLHEMFPYGVKCVMIMLENLQRNWLLVKRIAIWT